VALYAPVWVETTIVQGSSESRDYCDLAESRVSLASGMWWMIHLSLDSRGLQPNFTLHELRRRYGLNRIWQEF